MNDIKFVPYEDFETVKRKAEKYIGLVHFGISQLERYGRGLKPVVFMSGDIINTIASVSNTVDYRRDFMRGTPPRPFLTFCGYEIRFVPESNVVSVGFDLIERGGE